MLPWDGLTSIPPERNSSLNVGGLILAEAALSFLGMGIPPPTSTWGNMLGGVASDVFNPPWWMLVAPGAALTLTILAFNLFLRKGFLPANDPAVQDLSALLKGLPIHPPSSKTPTFRNPNGEC